MVDLKVITLICTMLLILSSFGMIVTPQISAPNMSGNLSDRHLEREPNDNFSQAQILSNGQVINGSTGLLVQNPIDVFRIWLTQGEVLNAHILLTNSTGYKDKHVHFELYDWRKDRIIARSISGHPNEALSTLAKFTDYCYLMIIPWKGRYINYTLTIKWSKPQLITPGVKITDSVSNSSDNPTDWWRVHLDAGRYFNDVINITLDFDPDICDLNYRFHSEDIWFPFLWYDLRLMWFESFGGPALPIISEYPGYISKAYYISVTSMKGSCSYSLRTIDRVISSDGDNSPGHATNVELYEEKTQVRFKSNLDTGDLIDWYKLHLEEGQTFSVSLRPSCPWMIYRISIYRNLGYEFVEDTIWTNYNGRNGFVQFPFISALDTDDYYFSISGLLPFHPKIYFEQQIIESVDYELMFNLVTEDIKPFCT